MAILRRVWASLGGFTAEDVKVWRGEVNAKSGRPGAEPEPAADGNRARLAIPQLLSNHLVPSLLSVPHLLSTPPYSQPCHESQNLGRPSRLGFSRRSRHRQLRLTQCHSLSPRPAHYFHLLQQLPKRRHFLQTLSLLKILLAT